MYRYNTKNSMGRQEIFTGTFTTQEQAERWYAKNGNFFLSRGRQLILVQTNKEEK